MESTLCDKMSIERNFDVPFIARLALREKQIQQNYRPYIQVHKWFARRPGALFRGLLLSEFVEGPLAETYFGSHQLNALRVADPFMGGGTPLVEANRLGADILGYDINPMAWWIVGREIEHLDLEAYRAAVSRLTAALEREIGELYRTDCTVCGNPRAHAKCFLWVKTAQCGGCDATVDLFPGYVVARDSRHPLNVVVCAKCGELNEVADLEQLTPCASCAGSLAIAGPARRGSATCRNCGALASLPNASGGPPQHRMFAMEYHCRACKPNHTGRFFKRPSEADLRNYAEGARRWAATDPRFVPDDKIPPGDESTRLHRWGYKTYRELFNARQLLGLELSCRLIAAEENERVRRALATNLSDILRYNNMLVRYDTMALKALDIFSVHGFPVGLVRTEVNLLGLAGPGGKSIGSGGWTNIVEKYIKAKEYCDRPFEIRTGRRGGKVYMKGEWIGDWPNGSGKGGRRRVDLRCATATSAELEPASLDAVLTDPPYYDSVQYAELMDFCYAWLRKLVGTEGSFRAPSTRNDDELTGNATESRDFEHFTAGLSNVFQRMAVALKPGRPLAFTYHHNQIAAYYPVAVAILDAGLTCSAAFPCPAEMGGSIHINGTGSSVVDTILVCRAKGSVPHTQMRDSTPGVAEMVSADLAQLRAGGVRPTEGDTRCIIHGHLTRLVVWSLLDRWDPAATTPEKLRRVANAVGGLASVSEVRDLVRDPTVPMSGTQPDLFKEIDDRDAAQATVRGPVRTGSR